MNNIDRLLTNYTRLMRLPWAANIAGKQKVWFVVYPPSDERRLRARMPDFETHTLEAQHGWTAVDLTSVLPDWLAAHESREDGFANPEYLEANDDLEIIAMERIAAALEDDGAANSVVAVIGLASLFDMIRVSALIDRIEDKVRGRLLVFFPGEYRENIYRFMDARDGFNYMAIPITSAENFINS